MSNEYLNKECRSRRTKILAQKNLINRPKKTFIFIIRITLKIQKEALENAGGI